VFIIGIPKYDLTNKTFGFLKVIEYLKNGFWLCQCTCNQKKIIRSGHLRNGHVQSCGCMRKTLIKNKLSKPQKSYLNQRFGKLLVKKYQNGYWLCQCDCGNQTLVKSSDLRRNHNKSCGCEQYAINHDIIGQRFERLLVIKFAAIKNGFSYYICQCDCGNEIKVRKNSLKQKKTKSCGCLQRENNVKLGKSNLKPNRQKYLIYRIYNNYISRSRKFQRSFVLTIEEFKKLIFSNCYYCNEKHSNYIKDPKSDLILEYNGIDRINNNRGYEIDNVVPCCKKCNSMKSYRTLEQFKKEILKRYEAFAKFDVHMLY